MGTFAKERARVAEEVRLTAEKKREEEATEKRREEEAARRRREEEEAARRRREEGSKCPGNGGRRHVFSRHWGHTPGNFEMRRDADGFCYCFDCGVQSSFWTNG
ncbi:hypothetical protein EON65_41070 [archaeon]|nr:MAG: hypothetical protein EON65_41070 [archaeon]